MRQFISTHFWDICLIGTLLSILWTSIYIYIYKLKKKKKKTFLILPSFKFKTKPFIWEVQAFPFTFTQYVQIQIHKESTKTFIVLLHRSYGISSLPSLRFSGYCLVGAVHFLAWWRGWFGRHQNNKIWKSIPHCLMWWIWRERNAKIFEGCKWTVFDLKLYLLGTLFDWMTASRCISFSNFLEFLDHCNFKD